MVYDGLLAQAAARDGEGGGEEGDEELRPWERGQPLVREAPPDPAPVQCLNYF